MVSRTPDNGNKFEHGRVVITANAKSTLFEGDVMRCLMRHLQGDWGDVIGQDGEMNEAALRGGGRLFSVYHDRGGVRFYITTEADRSVTTILLPEDY